MKKKKILIVDDSPFFLETLEDSLRENFLVETASSGESAIKILETIDPENPSDLLRFDLIITDLTMPGISGYEVSEYVKNKNRTNRFTPVIMLTSKDISKEEARKHGCAAYVPKDNLDKVISMAEILLRS